MFSQIQILLLNVLFLHKNVLNTIQVEMVYTYPGVSSISEHTALKVTTNQFPWEQVCDKMKQVNIHE